jgi:hypothetical protein
VREIAVVVNGLAIFVGRQIYAKINRLSAKHATYFWEGAAHKYLLRVAKISIGAWRAKV